jgi:serine protease Do
MTILTARVLGLACVVAAIGASPARAQRPAPAPVNPLRDLNTAIEELARKVSPSIVQVVVTGYRSVEDSGRGDAGLVISRQRSVGSGAIIDADGYIVTNAHVVAGAQQVRVVLHSIPSDAGPLQSLVSQGATLPAQVVGVADDIDLALLKVDAKDLPALAFADYDQIRQGELVFAFGSPEGLRNSVTMGVVSSAARQLDPDSPSVYVQTDAPINPGNSGGPLVNVNGELVGLNTFILTQSGGSQGLGFAIPSVTIAAAYPQLRKFGHLHRGIVGVSVQAITPALAEGLALPRSTGVLVSDVVPDSPAAAAGVQVQDIIVAVNGKAIDSVPALTLAFSTRKAGDVVTLGIVRGAQTVSLQATVIERPRELDRLGDLVDASKNAVRRLGIVAMDVDDTTRPLLPDLRIPSGVLVAARRQESDVEAPLVTGDVIHAVNKISVRSLDGLRVMLDGLKPGTTVTLQIERDRRLLYVSVDLN